MPRRFDDLARKKLGDERYEKIKKEAKDMAQCICPSLGVLWPGGEKEIKMIRPLKDHVLVKRIEQDEQTPGGLYIPPAHRETQMVATVLACGPGKTISYHGEDRLIPLDVKVGDRVLIGKYVMNKITSPEGEETLMVKEDEILGVVES